MALQVDLDELGEGQLRADRGLAAELGLDHLAEVGERRALAREGAHPAPRAGLVVEAEPPLARGELLGLSSLGRGHQSLPFRRARYAA
jgi:hypothetical protein